jgi:hypothetical protein
MTTHELDRYTLITPWPPGVLKPWRSVERLELTTRQVRHLNGLTAETRTVGSSLGSTPSKPRNNRLDAPTAERARNRAGIKACVERGLAARELLSSTNSQALTTRSIRFWAAWRARRETALTGISSTR